MVEDQEFALVFSGPKEVLAKSRAPADHLPKLDVGIDRLGKDQINDLGDVDACIEHVDRDGNGQLRILAFTFQVVDQRLGPRVVVVHDAAEVASILWIHFVEQVLQQYRVIVITGKDDRFSQAAAVSHLDAILHKVADNLAVGLLVEHVLVDLPLLVFDRLGFDFVFLQLMTLFRGHLRVLDAFAQERRGEGVDFEGHEEAIGDGLVETVVCGGVVVFAVKQAVGIMGHHVLTRRGRQANLQSIEVGE